MSGDNPERRNGADRIAGATERLIAAIRRGPAHDAERQLHVLWNNTESESERVLIAAVVSACRPDR